MIEYPHRRRNPLTGEWVLVSPQRSERPWQGQVEQAAEEAKPQYDPKCYLCPGNTRAGGKRNPEYTSTFVFDNDFAALLPHTRHEIHNHHDLLVAQGEPGICKVICFSPRHDLTLASMPVDEIERVVAVWASEWQQLGSRDSVQYVQIFENRGAMMGASNPHPHCQVWATADLPTEPAKEQQHLIAYRAQHSACMLCDYVGVEAEKDIRMVTHNESFVAVVPYWAVWPYETLLLSKRHVADLAALTAGERRDLASILRKLTGLYDRLFETPFPYTMGFHQRPSDGEAHDEWHLHAHFYPPLLRSATIRKFMVGFEMLAMPQRDITPESAAARLRELASD